MKYAYDLHIHSVLSPCADKLMTLNNIFNMANIKGLNLISITDHNSAKQLAIASLLSESYDMLFIPGIEVTVSENFDVLVYFKHLEDALEFDSILENYIDKSDYDHALYNDQEILNIWDDTIGYYPYLLSRPTKMSIQKLLEITSKWEAIRIYAHIDRKSKSGYAYLDQYPLDGIEYQKIENMNPNNPKHFHNSDAHQIIDLLEVNEFNLIELEDLTIDAFFRYFNHD